MTNTRTNRETNRQIVERRGIGRTDLVIITLSRLPTVIEMGIVRWKRSIEGRGRRRGRRRGSRTRLRKSRRGRRRRRRKAASQAPVDRTGKVFLAYPGIAR